MLDYINSLTIVEFVLLLVAVFAALVQLSILTAYAFRPGFHLAYSSLLPGLGAIIAAVVLFASR